MNHTQITNSALNSLIEESKDTLEELSVVSCYNVAIEDTILELGSMPEHKVLICNYVEVETLRSRNSASFNH